MRDVLDDLVGWWQAGETVGMGTVVATWRSAPRPAGASMLVGPDGTAVGSVSGGCVEGAVYEEAKDAVETGVPTLERYGVSDDDAFAVANPSRSWARSPSRWAGTSRSPSSPW
jgi:xanthine dehydrogenase accessory factor